MRKRGLLARQDFACCQNCGGYEITGIAEEMVAKGKSPIGCCFYHHQDAASLRRGKDFYLGYGPMESKDLGTIGKPAAEVGKVVCGCLAEAGVPHEWGGDPDTRILVKVVE